MGWLVEGMFAAGGNHVWRTNFVECTSVYKSHTNQPAVIEPYVGDNHVASLGNIFLFCSFLCLLGFVFEDSHYLVGVQ